MTNEESKEDFFSRSLIVGTPDAFRQLVTTTAPLILLPKFSEFGMFNAAIKHGHSVIVPLGAEDYDFRGDAIKLHDIDRDGFVASLKSSKYENAEQLAKDTAWNITVLRRRLGFDSKPPSWAGADKVRNVIPAIIAGRWSSEYEGDKEIISVISGMSYDDCIGVLSPLQISSDRPILSIAAYWRLVSPYDAFTCSYRYWTPQDFARLEDSVIRVFLDDDINRYSHSLREGLLMTLILLAVYGSNANPYKSNAQEWVDGVIRKILPSTDIHWVV